MTPEQRPVGVQNVEESARAREYDHAIIPELVAAEVLIRLAVVEHAIVIHVQERLARANRT